MPQFAKFAVVSTILLTLCGAIFAQDPPQPGRLAASIPLSSGYSYALYLPSAYTQTKPWPVIFVLDPAARGRAAAERFIPGAEKYGYIIAASNDSRNGPIRSDAIAAMWNDVHSRFNVDPRRAYFGGMSGGARVAIYFANRCNDCAGVIACAAGYAYDDKALHYSRLLFFAIAGTYDSNYPELFEESESLDKLGATHRFDTFDGDHGWPPPENLTTAIAWLRLHEMARGTTPRDPAFIDSQFRADRERAQKLQSSGDSYRAYLAYKQIAADFSAFMDVSDIRKIIAAQADTPAVKSGAKAERAQITLQRELESPVVNIINGLETGAANPESSPRARALASDLFRSLQHEKDPNRIIALRRALGGIRIAAYGAADSARQRKDFISTAALHEIAAATRPDSPELLYNLACAYALQGDRKRSLRSLQNAIQNGFSNAALLRSDPDLSSVRESPEFAKLLQTLSP